MLGEKQIRNFPSQSNWMQLEVSDISSDLKSECKNVARRDGCVNSFSKQIAAVAIRCSLLTNFISNSHNITIIKEHQHRIMFGNNREHLRWPPKWGGMSKATENRIHLTKSRIEHTHTHKQFE